MPLTSKIKIGADYKTDLNKISTDANILESKNQVQNKTTRIHEKISDFQIKLHAEQNQSLLIILQGADTSGKDGTIKNISRAVNPQGLRIESFKFPTTEELLHDFLWRYHKKIPKKGEIVIFNRSYYEGVISDRIQKIVPKLDWIQRFDMINGFEKYLHRNKIHILKIFLHIDKDEQKKRLTERIQNPRKRWKIFQDDLKKYKLWEKYVQSHNDALNLCNSKWALWHVVPANKKWIRDYLVSEILLEKLKEMNPKFPKDRMDFSKVKII